jgi:hypothetical protein
VSRLFPPQQIKPGIKWSNKGRRKISHLTINGRQDFERPVYWSSGYGCIAPMDELLGISNSGFSPGVCELCCREGVNNAFIKSSDNIKRLAQIDISHDSVRKIVEDRGKRVAQLQHKALLEPAFTVEDCSDLTLITGTDGVMVPLVTDKQKQARRKTEAKKRKEQGRKSTARCARPRKGSDGDYKEFKVACFYDKEKDNQYVVGTCGNHEVIGRLLRKIASQLGIDRARLSYSVSDGAVWIDNNYRIYLPMLDYKILDCHHFKEHIVELSHILFGQNTPEAVEWKDTMYKTALENGSLVMLHKLEEVQVNIVTQEQKRVYECFYKYVSKRIEMTDYPYFKEKGMDIGSGPTESFCKSLTARLKGSGMRWDTDSAQAIMALAALHANGQWKEYWKKEAA